MIFKYLYVSSLGYVVYRDIFDKKKYSVNSGALAHKEAVFVTEIAAKDYCVYRNRLIAFWGDDKLELEFE